MRGGGGAASWALPLVLLGLQSRALASPDRVTFERPACAPVAFDEVALEQLLQIELAAAGVREVVIAASASPGPASPTAPPAARLALDGACADAGGIVAKLGSSASAAELTRWIPLGDVPRPTRPRTIAIVLAELVRSSWPALAGALAPIAPLPPAQGPSAPPMRPPPPRRITEGKGAPARAVTPARAPRWTLATIVEARGFFPQGGAFVGGHVGARVALPPPFTASGAIGAWRSSRSDPLGDVDAWLVSGALSAAAGGRVGAVELHAGPEIEIGWVRARGTPVQGAQGHTRDDYVILASLRGELRFPIGGPASGMLDVGFGAPLRGYIARADDRAALAVKNAAARVGVGVAVAF